MCMGGHYSPLFRYCSYISIIIIRPYIYLFLVQGQIFLMYLCNIIIVLYGFKIFRNIYARMILLYFQGLIYCTSND